METIHLVLDAKLLKAADRAAKRQKINRSALIRSALVEHLQQLNQWEIEERDSHGYSAKPQRTAEFQRWESIAA